MKIFRTDQERLKRLARDRQLEIDRLNTALETERSRTSRPTSSVFGALMALVAIQLLVWIVNAVDVGLTLQIQPSRVLLALGVAVTSGLIAGIAPARQASRMPPVEAMRAH